VSVFFLDPDAERALSAIPYAQGHGTTSERLGAGVIYYAITCMARARICVCLGSGGGFVPCLMRQAQMDLEVDAAETYLVDAVLPEAGYGGPDVPMGWIDNFSLLQQQFADIVILSCLSTEAANGYFAKNRCAIDYLHIDADHSFDAALADFENYLPLLQPSAFVTFHDSSMQSIQQVLSAISLQHPRFQCLDLPDVGAGIAILRSRTAPLNPMSSNS
jgi:hypothetical protein